MMSWSWILIITLNVIRSKHIRQNVECEIQYLYKNTSSGLGFLCPTRLRIDPVWEGAAEGFPFLSAAQRASMWP